MLRRGSPRRACRGRTSSGRACRRRPACVSRIASASKPPQRLPPERACCRGRPSALRLVARRRLLVGGAGHDQLVDRLELPAVADQLRWRGSRAARDGVGGSPCMPKSLAWRRCPAEVVLPEPVDDHAREQVPGPASCVGQPVRERRPAVRVRLPAGGRACHSLCASAAGHQHLQERDLAHRPPSGRVAAPEEVRLLEEVGPCVCSRTAGTPSLEISALTCSASAPWRGMRRARPSEFLQLRVERANHFSSGLLAPASASRSAWPERCARPRSAGRTAGQVGLLAVVTRERGRPMPWPVLLLKASVTVKHVAARRSRPASRTRTRRRGPCRTAGRRPSRRSCRRRSPPRPASPFCSNVARGFVELHRDAGCFSSFSGPAVTLKSRQREVAVRRPARPALHQRRVAHSASSRSDRDAPPVRR